MHTLKTARPRPELRPFVRTFAQRDIEKTSPVIREVAPAMVDQVLAFELGEPVDIWHSDGRHQVSNRAALCGTQTRFAAHMGLPPGTVSFGIFFEPAGITFLFGVPMYAGPTAPKKLNRFLEELSDSSGTDSAKVPLSKIVFELPKSFF